MEKTRTKLESLWLELHKCVCVCSCSYHCLLLLFFCVFYYFLNIAFMGDGSDSSLGVVVAQSRFADVSGRMTSTHTNTDSKAQLSLSLFHTRERGVLGWARMQVTRAFHLPRAAFAELFFSSIAAELAKFVLVRVVVFVVIWIQKAKGFF